MFNAQFSFHLISSVYLANDERSHYVYLCYPQKMKKKQKKNSNDAKRVPLAEPKEHHAVFNHVAIFNHFQPFYGWYGDDMVYLYMQCAQIVYMLTLNLPHTPQSPIQTSVWVYWQCWISNVACLICTFSFSFNSQFISFGFTPLVGVGSFYFFFFFLFFSFVFIFILLACVRFSTNAVEFCFRCFSFFCGIWSVAAAFHHTYTFHFCVKRMGMKKRRQDLVFSFHCTHAIDRWFRRLKVYDYYIGYMTETGMVYTFEKFHISESRKRHVWHAIRRKNDKKKMNRITDKDWQIHHPIWNLRWCVRLWITKLPNSNSNRFSKLPAWISTNICSHIYRTWG